MERIVAAFSGDEMRARVVRLLRSRGHTVSCACAAGAEAIRAVRRMGGGLVICGFRLPDMAVEELADKLGDQALVLVVAKPEKLALCTRGSLYKLPTPATPAAFHEKVDFLLSLEAGQSRPPTRSEDERAIIGRAKALLMEDGTMNEAEAHRYLQKRSMDAGSRLVDTAKAILGLT